MPAEVSLRFQVASRRRRYWTSAERMHKKSIVRLYACALACMVPVCNDTEYLGEFIEFYEFYTPSSKELRFRDVPVHNIFNYSSFIVTVRLFTVDDKANCLVEDPI